MPSIDLPLSILFPGKFPLTCEAEGRFCDDTFQILVYSLPLLKKKKKKDSREDSNLEIKETGQSPENEEK